MLFFGDGDKTEPDFVNARQNTGNNTLPVHAGADLPQVRPVPAAAAYIPADAVAVFTIAPKQLLGKAGGLAGILAQVGGDTPEMKPVKTMLGLFNAENLGFAVDQPLHVFVRANGAGLDLTWEIGVIAPVGDFEKINTALPNFLIVAAGLAKLPNPNLSFADQGGFQGARIPGMPLVMGYNKDAFILYGKDDLAPEPATKDELMPKLKATFDKANSLVATDALFKSSQQTTHDFGSWVHIDRLSKAMPLDDAQPAAVAQSEISSATFAGWFGKGLVRVDANFALSKPLSADPSGKGVPKELLDALPREALLVLTASANPDVIIKSIGDTANVTVIADADKQLAEMGLTFTTAKILGVLGGDVVLAALPADAPGASPTGMLVATIKDPAAVDGMIKELEAKGIPLILKAVGLQLFRKDNRLCLAPERLRSALEGANAGGSLPQTTRDLLASNDLSLHADVQAIAANPSAAPFAEVLAHFRSLTLSGNADVDKAGATLTINLTDDKSNSLSQLMQAIIKAQMSAPRLPGPPNPNLLPGLPTLPPPPPE